ncbi:MAG: response regulator [Deltaproteobacteria bacterium]|nr:response regulator [Deltaproteobacteria bacterium]
MEPAARILIVEPDVRIREALAECVRSMGLLVVTARDGIEAVAQLREGKPPAAVLLDMQLPMLNGNGVLHVMRGDPRMAAVPVIALTQAGESPLLPVSDQLRKPFDLDEIAKRLARLQRAAAA